MSTESNLDLMKDSKLSLSYRDVETDRISSVTGYIKKVDGLDVVIHNRLEDISINFNLETKDGKKLHKSNNSVTEIDVKTFREWKYENEVHIVLPSADDIEYNDQYPVSVTGSIETRYNIDFTNIMFNVNCHKFGVTSQKGGSEWKITDIKLSDDNDDKILNCGFHNVISDYDVFYIATRFKIGVFSINESKY